jgi:hypothetical protein
VKKEDELQQLIETSKEVGKLTERKRIMELAHNRICFDHRKGCDHAACYALSDLITLIAKEQK